MFSASYWLRRPEQLETSETRASFEHLYEAQVTPATGAFIDYTLSVPKWQFLNYLTDHKEILLHGSRDPDIGAFEPRQATDAYAFGNQRAVYAASDGLWALYYALINTHKHKGISRLNACFRCERSGGLGEPYYFFSLNFEVLADEPWRPGVVYLLPRETFVQEPPKVWRGTMTRSAQWASPVAVGPLAKLRVEPEDFPFLSEVRGHDKEAVARQAREDPEGFPWLERG